MSFFSLQYNDDIYMTPNGNNEIVRELNIN